MRRPGRREIFKNHSHTSRSCKFFKSVDYYLRIPCPFGIEDCWTRSPETGLLLIHSEFNRRIWHLGDWTILPEMFEMFPEMNEIFPHASYIPRPFEFRKAEELKAVQWRQHHWQQAQSGGFRESLLPGQMSWMNHIERPQRLCHQEDTAFL